MDTIRTLVSAGTVVGCVLAFTLATVADDLAPTADNSGVLTADGEQQLWSSTRPDGHAPIGVMGDHTHSRGEWMASVRYMYMFMNGNQGRGGNKSTGDVLNDYPVAPKDMTTNMVMFGMMNAPTDDLTFMVMVPYIFKEMSHRTRANTSFTTHTDGVGDIKLNSLYKILNWSRQQIHLNAGISLPTGSIDETDDTPGGDVILPYPMQLGSGTFDLLPGLTYNGQTDNWSWGSQLLGTVRLGRNDRGYSLGERGQLTAWGARKWTRWLSTSVRLNGQVWGDIDGEDDALNPALVPTADPRRRAGERIDFLAGVNIYGRESWYRGQRVAVEFGFPIYQALDGPQLGLDWVLVTGWQYAW